MEFVILILRKKTNFFHRNKFFRQDLENRIELKNVNFWNLELFLNVKLLRTLQKKWRHFFDFKIWIFEEHFNWKKGKKAKKQKIKQKESKKKTKKKEEKRKHRKNNKNKRKKWKNSKKNKTKKTKNIKKNKIKMKSRKNIKTLKNNHEKKFSKIRKRN